MTFLTSNCARRLEMTNTSFERRGDGESLGAIRVHEHYSNPAIIKGFLGHFLEAYSVSRLVELLRVGRLSN